MAVSSSSSHLGLLCFYSKQWDDPYMKIHKNGTAKAGGEVLGGFDWHGTTYATIRIVPSNNKKKNVSILILLPTLDYSASTQSNGTILTWKFIRMERRRRVVHHWEDRNGTARRTHRFVSYQTTTPTRMTVSSYPHPILDYSAFTLRNWMILTWKCIRRRLGTRAADHFGNRNGTARRARRFVSPFRIIPNNSNTNTNTNEKHKYKH